MGPSGAGQRDPVHQIGTSICLKNGETWPLSSYPFDFLKRGGGCTSPIGEQKIAPPPAWKDARLAEHRSALGHARWSEATDCSHALLPGGTRSRVSRAPFGGPPLVERKLHQSWESTYPWVGGAVTGVTTQRGHRRRAYLTAVYSSPSPTYLLPSLCSSPGGEITE